MGRKLVEKLLPALSRMELSENLEATAVGYQTFAVARDTVDSYRGDSRTLAEALRILQTADSLPYQYAGIALILVAASREEKGTYYRSGLDIALDWLEKAQALEPDLNHINLIEPLLYIYGDRFQDARLVLDYLHHHVTVQAYWLYRAEIVYHAQQEQYEEALDWCKRAVQAAEEVPERLRVRSMIGELHLRRGSMDEALRAFREAAHFAPKDAWLWHQISWILFQQGEHEKAARANRQALELQPDLAEAQELRSVLEKTESSEKEGLLGRLFGS
ncbi:MAG: tetratricopeptide repeat protein [Candidatus Promineifilaceae bacterium]|nr:tetratricopeptide repeat protein [Candidatus Promineifilaceae bacterium]